jgi:hypothetical protein
VSNNYESIISILLKIISISSMFGYSVKVLGICWINFSTQTHTCAHTHMHAHRLIYNLWLQTSPSHVEVLGAVSLAGWNCLYALRGPSHKYIHLIFKDSYFQYWASPNGEETNAYFSSLFFIDHVLISYYSNNAVLAYIRL